MTDISFMFSNNIAYLTFKRIRMNISRYKVWFGIIISLNKSLFMRIYVFLFLDAVFKYILSTFTYINYITHILCTITFLYPFRWNVSRLHFQLKRHRMHRLRLPKCIQLKLYPLQERRPPTTPNKWGIRKGQNVLFHEDFFIWLSDV